MASKAKFNGERINEVELDQLDRKERYTLFGLTVPYLALSAWVNYHPNWMAILHVVYWA